MKDLGSFLERLGGLHDAVIHHLTWTPTARTLRLDVDDLCSNFRGLSEYPGEKPGLIELQGVERISFAIDTEEGRLNIDEFVVDEVNGDLCHASISFWPTGRLTLWYRNADFPLVTLASCQAE